MPRARHLRAAPPPPEQAADDRLISPEEAAELIGVSRRWIMDQAHAERIPHVRIGPHVRFEHEQLRRWWIARRRGPGIDPWPK